VPKAINYKLLICYLPVVSLVFLFLYLGFYGTASSDDYADYMQVEKFGYLNTVKETYLHWGGRFTSYILVYPINPLNFGELNGPAIFNFLQISLFTFLSFLFSKYITKKNLKSIEFCICFSLLSLLLYCYLPKPVELLFWFTGSWVYLPGLIGLCYWLMLFEKEYINKVLAKSERGYMIMNSGLNNQTGRSDGKLTLGELKTLLPRFEILEEVPNTGPDNYVLVWGHNRVVG
jgi:hypothetical protein